MQLLRLAEATNAATGDIMYKPTKMIEDFDSCIWSERYRPAGDFTATFTKNVGNRWNDFPENSIYGLDGSEEVMIVESRVIDVDEKNVETLTVTGRTFETVQEGRVARPTAPGSATGDGLWYLHDRGSDKSNDWILYNTSGFIATALLRYWTTDTFSASSHGMLIPNYQITRVVSPDLPMRSVLIQPGQMYERILEILAMDDLGVRNIRPTVVNGQTLLTTKVYDGDDKSATVVFSSEAGHFKKASYGRSVKDAYTWTWNFYKDGFNRSYNYDYLHADGSPVTQSWQGRVGYVEDTSLAFTSNPSTDPNYVAAWATENALMDKGTALLQEHTRKKLFSCELVEDIPYIYKVDYELGDIVRVKARYGTDTPMRVAEHVRIFDREGERAYPTLSALGADVDNL